jgi:sulfhydrogenase subunit beta (sulfur reductase)
MVIPVSRFLPRADIDRLFGALAADGRRIVGPTIADGAVVYDELDGPDDLPHGWTAQTAPGSYRLKETGVSRAFDYGVVLTAWKRFTHPSLVPLTRARRDGDLVTVEPVNDPAPRLAFVGVRACELAALRIQERAMRAGPAGDHDHAARRDASLVVAVECAQAMSTCFCTSMGTGPEVRDGADVVLSELDEGFVVTIGSEAGAAIV